MNNKYIRRNNERVDAQENGEKTFDQVYAEEVQ